MKDTGSFKQMAPCPVFRKCGGCQLQNMDYKRQLQWKQDRCERLLGGFCRISPILGMENPYHYRNKVQAAFGVNRSGKIISGVYQSSTHRIVPVDSCQTEDKKADEIICTVRKLLTEFKLTAYNEYKGRGFLRHVLVKRGFSTDELMVVLVTTTPVFTAKKHFVQALLSRHPEITTIVQSVNARQTSMVLGEQEKVLYGSGMITDMLCGKKFRISARSFYQINPMQTEVLYGKAIEFAGLRGDERLLDAYCGIGTIGIIAAGNAEQVMGVEQNRAAVRDAVYNARQNKTENIYFYCADAGDFMLDMAAQKEKLDVLMMDPPRAGASTAFLGAVCKLMPSRIVYISCNPETLTRDLGYLTKQGGYTVKKIQPVDMFPHTNHIECVVLMSRKKGGTAAVQGFARTEKKVVVS